MTLNDGQVEELIRLAETQSATALVAYVRRLLAQARADALEEAAKACESMPHTKLRGQHMSDGTISLPATPGQCAAAIRARKDDL